METHPIPLPEVHKRLSGMSASLARHFAEVAPALEARFSPEDFATWAAYCETLAQSGWRAWESAEAFCHVSPFLLQHIEPAAFWQWAETGKGFARYSADVATAFFRAARLMTPQFTLEDAQAWIAGAHWYLKHHPAQPSLAAAYFQASPAIYLRYAAPVCDLWQRLGQRFAQIGVPKARSFFDISRSFVDQEHLVDPSVPWTLAQRIAPLAADLALQFLERYPDLALRLGTELVTLVHDITTTLLASKVAYATTFLRVLNGTLALLAAGQWRHALEWCADIAAATPEGMLAFLHHLPVLMQQLPSDRLQLWVESGLERSAQNAYAGEAYFALESNAALDRLHQLQGHVAFADVQRVLSLYTEGFSTTLRSGNKTAPQRFELRHTDQMPPGLQRGDHDLPTSDGTALFVPAYVATFDTAPENFAVYKVAILHQLGFYDCGTFTFRLHEWQRLAPHVQPLLPRPQSDTHRVSAFEQFFSSFAQPDYARHLFTVLEDARIDAFLARQYKGLRQDLSRLMQHSLTQRPDLSTLRLRQALLEGLLQLTLGGDVASDLTPALHPLLQRLYQRAQRVERPDATVYDTATAVTECYHLIMQIPQNAMLQLAPEALEQLQALTAAMDDDADMLALADMFQQAGEGADVMPIMPESDEPALGTEPVPYRGDLKPELIEKKLQLQELTEELDRLQEGLSPLPPEVLKELLENGNVEITSLQEGDLQGTSGLFLSDLEGRQNELRDDLARLESLQEAIESLDSELGDALGHLKPVDSTYLYDEWDYQMQDYRRGWCRLNEIVLDEEDTSFIQETRQRHAELLNQIRQQFQLLKPEMFKKIKRLIDGEEIDLDSAIEAHIDRRAGNMPSEKVYTRRQKRDRDVAAAFLLDMSASTDDEVPEILETEAVEVSEPTPPRPFDFSGFVVEDYYQAPAKPRQDPNRRRIIDVEKEALVLMAEALETLGDAYAVYGFSGYGRDQVEFFVAKEFTELYDSRAQGRIAAMKPHRSTRMGPAIRHAIRKLERQDARIKTLLMLSDGYPQDFDYGKDRKSKDYGIQDTMMALREAQLKGIQTFCITVDPSGHDYLREMCPDQQYLVIDDITALPDELPKVYRGLTT
jgi:hypothetical protein